MQLNYNSGTHPQYNGNIASQYWGTPGSLSKNYSYLYDKLNRLLSGESNNNYAERGITYDAMGNINTLSRKYNGTLIDSLLYTYGSGSNQLVNINDRSADAGAVGYKTGTHTYVYDGNGNIKTDNSKGATGITIAYNLLNLPQAITGSNTITYTYDAAGNKLHRSSAATNQTDYISGIEYDGTTTATETLSFIQTEEGKAVPNGTGYDYEYYLGDHLGNTRVTFKGLTSGGATSMQTDDYLPFGMDIASTVTSPKNEYLYNKKELQEELGQYDYGARLYDPVVGRWTSVDPLAENSRRFSPYIYGDDNSIRNIDPDGMDVNDWVKKGHKYFWDDRVVDQKTATTYQGGDAKYVGEKATIYSVKDGNVLDETKLNSNGTVTRNNVTIGEGSETTFTNVAGSEFQPRLTRGNFIGLSSGFSLLGGYGISVGRITDATAQSKWYFTLSGNIGFGFTPYNLDLGQTIPADGKGQFHC
ncbi:MAG: RHS repeat-associated core domain-containing protein [Bacteroidota bacterium]|nr:RHS repeat-associated core domain-containing protein [Bacteroidota bacterium]